MLRVRRDLKDYLVPAFLSWQGHLPPSSPNCSRAYPPWLWTPPGLGNTQFPWAIQFLTTFTVWNFFPVSSLNFLSFSLYPCLAPTIPDADSLSSFSVGALQIQEGCCDVSMQPSLLQAEQFQLSQPVFMGKMFWSSDQFHGPLDWRIPCPSYTGDSRVRSSTLDGV